MVMKSEEMATFLDRIGTMLQKGYSLYEAIELYGILESKKTKKQTDEMLVQLKQGEPFYIVLKNLHFPNIILALLYFSERHGNLSFSLIEGGKMLREKTKNMNAIKRQLKYPLFLLTFLIIVLLIVTKQLVPQFEEVFQSLNYDVPSHMQLMLAGIKYLPYLFVSCFFSLTVAFLIVRVKKQKIKIETLLQVPILKKYLRRYMTQFFSLHLSCLLASGISLKDCFSIFSKQEYVLFISNETKRINERLKDGEKIEEVILSSNFFEKELAKVIGHGQANSKLPEDLLQYSNLLQEDLQKAMNKGISLLQPVAFLIIGLVICALFVAVILPVFQMVQAI
jgi:competence protein ComGB